MDADTGLEDPAGRRILEGLPLLIGEGGLVSLESPPDAILQGGIDQPTDGHDHEQRHDPFGFLEVE